MLTRMNLRPGRHKTKPRQIWHGGCRVLLSRLALESIPLAVPTRRDRAVELVDAPQFTAHACLYAVCCLVYLVREVIASKHLSIAGPAGVGPPFEIFDDLLGDDGDEFLSSGPCLWRFEGPLEGGIE